ncbi:MAG TPA: potassium-transporting ATPase subunit KdpC [Elusimicrobiota bacterium]|nr:potassium-transporting ATPase subunit KdpC [Elusimicrobiota bacterium]
MKTLLSQLRPAALMFAAFSILTGLAYPALVTGLAQFLFPWQANGSLIVQDGKVAGSELIGQSFSSPMYFWSRPSATTPFPYNAASSSGSNLGPTNPALLQSVQARVGALRASEPGNAAPIPPELVTASGSGLDPDISPAAALWQLPRVAAAVRRYGISEAAVRALVLKRVQGRALGIFGEPRVNVLMLNESLRRMIRSSRRARGR